MGPLFSLVHFFTNELEKFVLYCIIAKIMLVRGLLASNHVDEFPSKSTYKKATAN